MPPKPTSKDIYNKVKKDQETHHIFSDADQDQLVDIIRQLGEGGNVTEEIEKQIAQQSSLDTEKIESVVPGNVVATDEEIADLFNRLSTFDLQKINEKQGLYNIYLNKLRKYKKLPNFNKVLQKGEYYLMIIDHLNYLSDRIIGEQREMEKCNIKLGSS